MQERSQESFLRNVVLNDAWTSTTCTRPDPIPNLPPAQYRWHAYKSIREAIEQNEGGLAQFSQGYKYYGFNRGEKDGATGIWYREWAPGARVSPEKQRAAVIYISKLVVVQSKLADIAHAVVRWCRRIALLCSATQALAELC